MAGKAADGESSIFRDEAGRWHGYVSFGRGLGGRRDRRHVSGQRRAEVVAKVRELEQRRDAGIAATAGRAPTVGWWLDHWLDTIAARKVRPSTLQGYRSKVRSRIKPAIGHVRLDKLQPEHLEAFYASIADQVAPASALQMHRIISRALKVAMQRGRVSRNVAQLLDAPTPDRQEVQPLTPDEARAVLAAAADARNAARWSVALALGLRQGEVLALGWDDVDLDAGTLTVRRAMQRLTWQHGCARAVDGTASCGERRGADCATRHGGGLVFDDPKSRAGRRTIALPASLTESLRAHRSAQLVERMQAGAMWQDHGLVFAQVNGRPIDPRRDWKAWKNLLATAGVRDARLHDARHTAATLLLVQGVAPRVAMQILGHSQIHLTLGTYSHVIPELARDAADRMDAALWGPGGTEETAVATTVAPRRRRKAVR